MPTQTPLKRKLYRSTPRRLLLGVLLGVLGFVIITGVDPHPAAAATNSTINFQAKLMTAAGAIAADGYYNVQFNLYTALSGGTSAWTETRDYNSNSPDNRVRVVNGYLTVNLGSVNAFPTTINWDQNLYLGMTVRGTAACAFASTCTPADAEMSPRLALTATPYAFSAGKLSQLNGTYTSTLTIQGSSSNAQNFVVPDQGTAGTYNLLTTTAANAGYIQNQNSIQQATSNFWISGTGRSDTSFVSPLFDTTSAGLNIGTSTATSVTIGGTTNTTAVTLQGATAANYNIGTTTGTGTITVGQSTASNTINIGNGVTGTGNTQTVNIATGSTGTGKDVVTIGSTNGASSTTINAGNGNITLNGNVKIANTGSLYTQAASDYTATGITNDVNLGAASLVRLNGASAQTITGIVPGTSPDGRRLTIVNAASTAATISNNSGSSTTAADRIITGTGSDITLPAGASVELIYDASASFWRVTSAVASTIAAGVNTIGALQTTPTAANGAYITGTSLFLQSANASYAGLVDTNAQTFQGAKTFNTLLTGTAGVTVSGAGVSLNDSSNFNTTINTGTSTGTVTIGNTLAGAISLQTASTVSIETGTTGTAFTVGNTTSNPNVAFNGSGSFGTTTGAVGLNGNTTVATGKTFTVTNGATSLTGGLTQTGGAFSLTGNAASTLTTANAATGGTATLGLSTGNATTSGATGAISIASGVATSGNSGAISIASGAAAGSGNAAGNITIDTGAATSSATAGTINIGNTNAGTIALGNNSSSATTITVGNTTVGGYFQNNGASLNYLYALGNFTANGALTTAANINAFTAFTIPQTNAGISLTIPSPTTNTSVGHTITVYNLTSSTNSITVGGVLIGIGGNSVFMWNGSAWSSVTGTGVTTVGAISGTSNANGATISGNTITLTPADGTNGGVLTNTTQNIVGAKTFTTSITSSGLITGNAGLTATGAAVNLNASSNFATNINTGTSTGAVTIGNSSASAISLATGSTFGITSTGAFTLSAAAASSLATTAGNLSLDSAATVNVGITNATGVSIGKSGATTTVNGALTASQLLTGSAGLTATGAAINLNASSNFAVNIGTGTSTGTVTIGNSANTVAVNAPTTVAANLSVTNAGSFATAAGSSFTTAGVSNNALLNTAGFYLLNTSGAAQIINGIAAGRDGQLLTLTNVNGSNSVTLSNNSGSATGSKIITGTGSDVVLPTNGTIDLIYDGTNTVWRVSGAGSATGGYIQNQNSSSQTGATYWISGAGRSDTAFQAPLVQTVDTTSSNSTGITLRSGNTTTSGNSGTVTIKSGDAAGTSGAISIDNGSGASNGAITLGLTNASQINLGHSGITTAVTGNLTQATGTLSLTANGASTISTSSGALTLQGAGGVTFGTTTSVTATGALTITSGGTSALSLDTSSSSAAVSIGTSTAGSVSIGKSGATTTVNGALTSTQLLTGSAGLTVTGAAVNLNASSNFATNINTGSSTGAVSIGNAAAGAITLQSVASIGLTAPAINLTGAAAVTGTLSVSGITSANGGLILQGDNYLATKSYKDSNTHTGLIIPLYYYPSSIYTDTIYNNLIAMKKKYHDVPVTVVINVTPPITSTDANYTAAISRLHGAGITVLGYVDTNYKAVTGATAQGVIDSWQTYYPAIDGIFLDRMTGTNGAGDVAYYQTLTRYAHGKSLYPIIGNAGSAVNGAYYTTPAVDVVIDYENSSFPSEATLQGDFAGGNADYNYKNTGAIVYSQAFNYAQLKMMRKYNGMLYVTDRTPANQYANTPTYLETLFQALITDQDTIIDTTTAQTGMYSPLLDTTTASTTLSIGTGNATSIVIGKSGVTTTIGGTTAIGATAGSGALVNNGATVNTVSNLSLGSSGSIGANTATVDVYSNFSITATAAALTFSVPTPTASTTYGRLIYVTNISATNIFTLINSPLRPGATAVLVWANVNGVGTWTFAGADNASILNQTTQQASANFNISGTGVAGNFQVATAGGFDTAAAGVLNIGLSTGGNATSINLNQNTTVASGKTFTVTSGATSLTGPSAGSSTAATIATGAASNVGLKLQAAASQTADLLQLQDSTGANLVRIDASGNQESIGYINTPGSGSGQYGNLLTYSEQFDNAAWTKTATITANSTVAPDGNTTADTIAAGSTGAYALQTSALAPTNTNYTFSVWLRTTSGTQNASIRIKGSTGGVGTEQTAAVTTTWQRFSVTQNVNGYTGAVQVNLFPGTSSGTGTVIAWGAQLVNASNAQAYTRTLNTTQASVSGSVSNGTTFTNNGSTLNSSIALSDLSTGGSIGTNTTPTGAAGTVDIATSFTINQTTTLQTITIPSPTNTAAGRVIYISNTGSANFTLLSSTLASGSTATLLWNGTAWTYAGADGASILNQNSTTQTANFIINGTGVAAALQASTTSGIDTNSSSIALNLAQTNANAINIGKTTTTATIYGSTTLGQTAGTGIVTNNGATLNTTTTQTTATASTPIANINAYTSFVLTATTGVVTYTLANPTPTTAGKLIYIGNASSGSNTFTLIPASGSSVLLNPGSTTTLVWNGAAWTYAGADSSGLQAAYGNSTGLTTPEIMLDNTRNGVDIQDAVTTLGSTQSLFTVRGSATASTLGASLFNVSASGKIGINIGSTSTTPTISNDLSFGAIAGVTTARTIGVEAQTTANVGGNGLQISGGAGNGTGTGGSLTLQAGASGTGATGTGGATNVLGGTASSTNGNGGNVTISGGAKSGTGTGGSVIVKAQTGNDTAAVFQVQNAAGATILNVNSTTANVSVNNGGLTVSSLPAPTGITIALTTTGGSLTNGGTYYYKVGAYNASGFSLPSFSTPNSLTTANGTSRVTVSWTAVPAASGYYVYRSNDGGGTYLRYDAGNVTSLSDTGSSPTWSGGNTINDRNLITSGSINAAIGVGISFGSNTQIYQGAYDNTLNVGNFNAGGAVDLLGDSFAFIDTTGYNADLNITNTGQTVFRNRVDQATAFQIQNTGGASQFTVDTITNKVNLQNTVGASLLTADSGSTADGNNLIFNGGAEYYAPPNGAIYNWVGYGGGTVANGTGTDVASGNYSIKATFGTVTGNGIKLNAFNNTPPASTTDSYLVSFNVKQLSGSAITPNAASGLTVYYSPNNGGNLSTCTNYSVTTALATNTWYKVSCLVTPGSTAVTFPVLIIAQTSPSTPARVFDFDNANMVLRNTTGAQSTGLISIGGATSQGLTLFQLDTAAGNPFLGLSAGGVAVPALAGAMYFDTTAGKMQCYDGSNWGACGAAPNSNITLTPEYAGAVLNGTGIGTLTSDFCSNGALNVGTLCASGDARNFYKWTSPQGSAQTYNMYLTYKLPSTFKAFLSGTTTMTGRVDNTTNADLKYAIFKKASAGGVTSCSAIKSVIGAGAVNTWLTTAPTTDPSNATCSFAANDSVIFQIQVSSLSNANAYAENLNFQYSNQ